MKEENDNFLTDIILNSLRINGIHLEYLVKRRMFVYISWNFVEIIFSLIGLVLGFIFGNAIFGCFVGFLIGFPSGIYVGFKVKKRIKKIEKDEKMGKTFEN